MEQDNMQKQIAQTKMWAISAAIIGMLILLFALYFGRQMVLRMPKPMDVPVLAMREMIFTQKMQEDMFARQPMDEVKFEWVTVSSNDTTYLSLAAVGGYMNGEKFEWDDGSRVTLSPGNRTYYADATRYNFGSPLYYSLDDIKAMQRISEEGPIEPGGIIVDVTMTPSTISDASRRYCIYYAGASVYESRTANPAPPFSSLSETR